jgi:hypothetical protein
MIARDEIITLDGSETTIARDPDPEAQELASDLNTVHLAERAS